MPKLILIDGNSLINRAFYAMPPLSAENGVPTQAVYGFTTMLIKLISNEKPDELAVAFDLKAPTFRHKMYDKYKANRKGMPDELAVQLPLLKNLLTAMNIAVVEKEGYEADDVIGTIAKRHNGQTLIVTGDRDSFQLIDENISVMFNKRGITEVQLLTDKNIVEFFELTPKQVIDYKALAGDSSDNIPGVQGIGDKSAINLLKNYGSLDGIYAHIDEITGAVKNKLISGKDMALLSKTLAVIDTNVPLDEIDLTFKFPFSAEVKRQFETMKFKSLLKNEFFEVSENPNPPKPKKSFEVIGLNSYEAIKEAISKVQSTFAFAVNEDLYFSADGEKDYKVVINNSLLSDGVDLFGALKIISPILTDDKILKIVFDVKTLKKSVKINQINNVFDVRLAQYLIDMDADSGSLAELSSFYGIENDAYGCALFYIKSKLEEALEKTDMNKLYYDIELPLTEVLYKMEQVGFTVDTLKLEELGISYADKISLLIDKIYKTAGMEFNLNSPKQLSEVLFDKLGIPFPLKNKKRSTGAEILERLVEYPIVKDILDYRAVSKLKSTYIDGLKKLVSKDGIVHTEFNQMLTTTGRLSSKEPNLQNIPVRDEQGKQLREAFIARKGCTLVSADYSQIELRLLASFSGDERMIKAYRNGEDIHAATAAEIFDVKLSEVTSAMRREAKVVNFGIIYGMSDYGLAQSLGISASKAHIYKAKYFERFSAVKAYMDNLVKIAKEKGYAETVLSRKRKIPELFNSQFAVRGFGERAAMNMPLQGSAADIIKIAMVKVDKALERMNSKLILQIHDELIVDALDTEIQQVKDILKSNMENCIKLEVPLEVNIKCGKRWSEC